MLNSLRPSLRTWQLRPNCFTLTTCPAAVIGAGFCGEMKIKIISMVACPPWNLSALPGDEVEVDEKQGTELISLGRAKKLDEAETEEPKKPAKKKVSE